MGQAPYKLLNRTFDTIRMRLGSSIDDLYPSDWLMRSVSVWRQWKADRENDDRFLLVNVGHESIPFKLKPTAPSSYEFHLENDEIGSVLIWNPEKWDSQAARDTGAVFVDFRSKAIQTRGMDFVRATTKYLIASLFLTGTEDLWARLSRIDVAVDIQTPLPLRLADIGQFVSKSKLRFLVPTELEGDEEIPLPPCPRPYSKGAANLRGSSTYYEIWAKEITERGSRAAVEKFLAWALKTYDLLSGSVPNELVCNSRDRLNSIRFGVLGGAVWGKIYDKTKEIEVSGKDYMKEVWLANGWDGKSTVLRVEFSLTKDFLKSSKSFGLMVSGVADTPEQDLRDPSQFLTAVPEVWAYLTSTFLRRIEDAGDRYTDRAAVHQMWCLVQSAWPDAVPTVRAELNRPDPKQLIAQGVGCIQSAIAASSDAETLSNKGAIIRAFLDRLESEESDLRISRKQTERSACGIAQWDTNFCGDDALNKALARYATVEQ